MNELGQFIVEKTIINSFAIFLSALLASIVFGRFLKQMHFNIYLRICCYSVIASFGGLWSYSIFDIAERRIESVEGIILFLAMFIYSGLVISLFFRIFNNRTSGSHKIEAEKEKFKLSSFLSFLSNWFFTRNGVIVGLIIVLSIFAVSYLLKGKWNSQLIEKTKGMKLETALKLGNINLEQIDLLETNNTEIRKQACRDNYLKYRFYTQCESLGQLRLAHNKFCQIVLTNQNDNEKAEVFTNGQLVEANYKMVGLTMIWNFTDGSNFQLEPNGYGIYNKAQIVESTIIIDGKPEKSPAVIFDTQNFKCEMFVPR